MAALKIICSGHLIRYPMGGFTWHHLQYLIGLRRMGHEVIYLEHFGWSSSCYDPQRGEMTSTATHGIAYLQSLLAAFDLDIAWCYLGENGVAQGLSRRDLASACADCDLYLNLSNINWIPELQECPVRVLVDTDPVFTQIGAHGLGGPFSNYHARFTYGENVHLPGCDMPTGGIDWMNTRQPVVLDLWVPSPGNGEAPFTSVMNWSAYGEHDHDGRSYGQKDREFTPFFDLPEATGLRMELAVNAPGEIRQRLVRGGWQLADPRHVTRTPYAYQAYIAASSGEFSVAKHAYVSTQSGWFSDRSCGYLATGRPVVLQDTGFSRFLPSDEGLLAFRDRDEAITALRRVSTAYAVHCRAARSIAERYFDHRTVLTDLLERALAVSV